MLRENQKASSGVYNSAERVLRYLISRVPHMKNAIVRAVALLALAASPALATPVSAAPLDTVVFGGGCFWGVQAVFQHVNGVVSATSGYAGGTLAKPSYEQVSTGTTGHA